MSYPTTLSMLLLTVCWLIPLLTLVPTLYGRNGCMGFVTSFGIIAVSSCQCLPFRLNFLITNHSRLHKRTMSCTIIADSEVNYQSSKNLQQQRRKNSQIVQIKWCHFWVAFANFGVCTLILVYVYLVLIFPRRKVVSAEAYDISISA